MRSGIVETIHYEQPNSRISAGDPLPSSRTAGSLREIHTQAAKQPDLCGRSTTKQPSSRISAGDPHPSSRTAGSLREIHYQAAKQPDLCGRSTTSSRTAGSLREIHYPSCLCVLLPLRLCAFASLRLFLYDSRNEVSLMRGPTGNSHQRSPPCGSEQEALSSAAPASAAPRDAYP